MRRKITFGFLKNEWKEILLLTLCALISIIISILFIKKSQIIDGDTVWYIDIARNLANGKGFVYNYTTFDREELLRPLSEWMPLYPIFIFILIKFGFDHTFSARLIPLAFLPLIIFSTYYMAKRIYEKKVAIMSAIFLSFSYPLCVIGYLPLADSMFSFFAISSMLLLSKIITDEIKFSEVFTAGAFIGLSYLTKGNGLILIAVAFFLLYFMSSSASIALKRFLILLGGFFVLSGAWLIRNQITFGFPLYYGQFEFRLPSFNAFADVLSIAFFDNLPLILFLPYIVSYMPDNTERRKILFLISFPAAFLLFFTFWSAHCTRLLFPSYPFLIILSTKSFCGMFERIANIKGNTTFLFGISIAIIIIAQLILICNYYNKLPATDYGDEKWAEWIRSNTDVDDVIITNEPARVRYLTWRYCVATDAFTLHREDVKLIIPHSFNLTELTKVVNYYKELYIIARTGAIRHLNISTLPMTVRNLNAEYIALFKKKVKSKERNGEFIYNLSRAINVPECLDVMYNDEEVIIYRIKADKLKFNVLSTSSLV